jgi:hypothetical protein
MDATFGLWHAGANRDESPAPLAPAAPGPLPTGLRRTRSGFPERRGGRHAVPTDDGLSLVPGPRAAPGAAPAGRGLRRRFACGGRVGAHSDATGARRRRVLRRSLRVGGLRAVARRGAQGHAAVARHALRRVGAGALLRNPAGHALRVPPPVPRRAVRRDRARRDARVRRHRRAAVDLRRRGAGPPERHRIRPGGAASADPRSSGARSRNEPRRKPRGPGGPRGHRRDPARAGAAKRRRGASGRPSGAPLLAGRARPGAREPRGLRDDALRRGPPGGAPRCLFLLPPRRWRCLRLGADRRAPARSLHGRNRGGSPPLRR